jgi:uncharacterized protein YqgV (UPF0045/DUF77 family)
MTGKKITLGIQIVPKSMNKSKYELVDAAIDVIIKSGIKHQLTPFETVMEGTYEELMMISEIAQKAVLEAGAEECLVYYRIHYRKTEDVTFKEKRLNR